MAANLENVVNQLKTNPYGLIGGLFSRDARTEVVANIQSKTTNYAGNSYLRAKLVGDDGQVLVPKVLTDYRLPTQKFQKYYREQYNAGKKLKLDDTVLKNYVYDEDQGKLVYKDKVFYTQKNRKGTVRNAGAYKGARVTAGGSITRKASVQVIDYQRYSGGRGAKAKAGDDYGVRRLTVRNIQSSGGAALGNEFKKSFEAFDKLKRPDRTQKLNFVVKTKFFSKLKNESQDFYFHSKTPFKAENYSLQQLQELAMQEVQSRIDDLEGRDSGLVLEDVQETELYWSELDALAVQAPGSSFTLPPKLAHKKCCINIKNEDNKCFYYAMICLHHKLYQGDNAGNMNKYIKKTKHITKDLWDGVTDLNFEGVNYPITRDDIIHFDEQNPQVSLTIYSWDGENANLYYSSPKHVDEEHHYYMVIAKDGNRSHICPVTSNGALTAKLNKHNRARHICPHCDEEFSSQTVLYNHINKKGCMVFQDGETCYTVPCKDDDKAYSKFDLKNLVARVKSPFMVYADFECVLKKMSVRAGKGTEKVQEHVPCSWGMLLVSRIPQVKTQYFMYRGKDGEDTMEAFFNKLDVLKEVLYGIIRTHSQGGKNYKDIVMTEEDVKNHKKTHVCWLCKRQIKTSQKKVADHCHFTGQYRGAAHESCNLNVNYNNYKIPVMFHNLKGYDAHNIFKYYYLKKHIVEKHEDGKLTNKLEGIIPTSSEKYMAFTYGYTMNQFNKKKPTLACHFHFKDSLGFVLKSLDGIASKMKQDDFTFTKKFSARDGWSAMQTEKLMEKGVYPYEYFDSFERFDDVEYPHINRFSSTLKSGATVSELEWRRGQEVFQMLGEKLGGTATMGDYSDLYLKTDVLLLADVFERFVDISMEGFGLDPSYFYTAANYSWIAAFFDLSQQEVKVRREDGAVVAVEGEFRVENIAYRFDATDRDGSEDRKRDAEQMYRMVERMKRGGYSGVSLRYASVRKEDSNVHVDTLTFDEPGSKLLRDEKAFIKYFDATNLYGGIQCMRMPYRGLTLINKKKNNYKHLVSEWTTDAWKKFILDFDVDEDIDRIEEEREDDMILRKSFFVEFSFKYPDGEKGEELKQKTKDFPFAFSNQCIPSSEFSDKFKQMYLKRHGNLPRSERVGKLIQNQGSCKSYVAAIELVKFWVEQGLEITGVQNVIEYEGCRFLKHYILKCTAKRNEAKKKGDDFGVTYYKLLCNSLYGKSLEDVKNRRSIAVANDSVEYRKSVRKGVYKKTLFWGDDEENTILATESVNAIVVLNKPMFIGCKILDMAKWYMYRFHYEVMTKQFDDIRLVYTDTDSLIYKIRSDDFLGNLVKVKDWFDYTFLDEDHPLHVSKNEKYLLKFKDELGGIEIGEIIALRSKMYSFLCIDSEDRLFCYNPDDKNKVMCKAKGVTGSCFGKREEYEENGNCGEKISHADYRTALVDGSVKSVSFGTIASKGHAMTTNVVNKTGICGNDSKRRICDDGIDTEPYCFEFTT